MSNLKTPLVQFEALCHHPTAGCPAGEPGPDLATSSFQTLMPFAFSAATALFLPGWLIQQPHGLLQPPGTDQAATYRRRCSEPGEALQQGERTPRSEPGCRPGPPPSFPTAAGGSAGKGNTVCPAGCPVNRQQRGLGAAALAWPGQSRGLSHTPRAAAAARALPPALSAAGAGPRATPSPRRPGRRFPRGLPLPAPGPLPAPLPAPLAAAPARHADLADVREAHAGGRGGEGGARALPARRHRVRRRRVPPLHARRQRERARAGGAAQRPRQQPLPRAALPPARHQPAPAPGERSGTEGRVVWPPQRWGGPPLPSSGPDRAPCGAQTCPAPALINRCGCKFPSGLRRGALAARCGLGSSRVSCGCLFPACVVSSFPASS